LIYEARAAGLAFFFSAAINAFAAGPEECGFWPVVRRPSVTTCTPQFADFENTAPVVRCDDHQVFMAVSVACVAAGC
jgi:hypothetical protein